MRLQAGHALLWRHGIAGRPHGVARGVAGLEAAGGAQPEQVQRGLDGVDEIGPRANLEPAAARRAGQHGWQQLQPHIQLHILLHTLLHRLPGRAPVGLAFILLEAMQLVKVPRARRAARLRWRPASISRAIARGVP